MRVRGVTLWFVVMFLLTSCSLLPKAEPSAPTVTTTTTPTLTPRHPPEPNYNVDYCGVSGTAHSGKPSNVLLTIDDYPSDAGVENGKRMIEIADWAHDAGVLMEAFPIKSKTDAHLKATGTDLIEELRKRGTYVSNHSYSHPELPKLDPAGVAAEIQKGVRSTYLRPPYGSFTPAIKQQIESEGYRICIWNIDTNDWRTINGEYPSPEELARRVHAQLMTIPSGEPVVILGHYYTEYPNALSRIVKVAEQMGNRVCPAPRGPVTEEVPFPIC